MRTYNVALMGRGLVAQKIYGYLKGDEDIADCDCYCAEETTVKYGSDEVTTFSYSQLGHRRYDVIFGATDSGIVKDSIGLADYDLLIDNSELLRLSPSVPLLVGRTNFDRLPPDVHITANPNCVAAMVARVLIPLNRRYPLSKAIITTFQSVSGLGYKALEAFAGERDDDVYLEGRINPRFRFRERGVRIYDNVVPLVGELESDGWSHEEDKIQKELTKLLGPDFESLVMCARVPVTTGHSAYLHLTFKDQVDQRRIEAFLDTLETLELKEVATPAEVRSGETVMVSRIKGDRFCPYALSMFVTADNLTVGSALNSYEIFKAYKRSGR